MDDGGPVGYGLKLATNSFTFEDTTRLAHILLVLYGIKASLPSQPGCPRWRADPEA